MVRIGKTGTERCAFCRLEEHDEMYQGLLSLAQDRLVDAMSQLENLL